MPAGVAGGMSDLPLVVVADPIDADAVEQLRGGPCRVQDASADPASLAAVLPGAWGLVVRSRTKVTRELLAAAPQLRLVARAGVGVDNVDRVAAAARGITVVNAPQAATASVAELSVALYLLLVRELRPKLDGTRAGRWERGTSGHELQGRTVGFLGYGRIAREVARRLAPFGTTAIAFDPFVRTTDDGTRIVPFDELLSGSDIVSVHAAQTSENRHLLNAAAFARMRRGAFVVNVARGSLVDEAALLAALESGQVGGAALDVLEVEPPVNRALVEHPRVIVTPHLGASTHEAQRRAGRDVVEEVLRALRHEPLRHAVPAPEVRA
ncbi:D-3-phosphoglycerate dehydrogenase [mine drainage metagenome]|uniref:D-3-phosphoglycerate dehydrogenase n=1 Tax=mine drainage metagenome TaxID=410659 RepID=T0ZGG3_9ZZZZ